MQKQSTFARIKQKSRTFLAVCVASLGLMSVTSAQADSSCADSCVRVWGTTAKQNCEFAYFNCKRVYAENIDYAISEINACDVDDIDCKMEKIANACNLKNAYNTCNLRVKFSYPRSTIPR